MRVRVIIIMTCGGIHRKASEKQLGHQGVGTDQGFWKGRNCWGTRHRSRNSTLLGLTIKAESLELRTDKSRISLVKSLPAAGRPVT